MNAFNYDTQKWESGDSAACLLREQRAQELAILRSGRAESYLRFCGRRETVAEAIRQLQSLLA